MWPIRTAISGKQNTPGGATEIMDVLGKEIGVTIHCQREEIFEKMHRL